MELIKRFYSFHVSKILFIILALIIYKAEDASSSIEIPREILSLYFNAKSDSPRLTPAHRYGEVILNHLGVTVRHHNLRNGLPSLEDMANVRGILAWFDTVAMPEPSAFIRWAIQNTESGKRLVLLGYPAFVENLEGRKTPKRLINELMKHLGLQYDDSWVQFTYDMKFLKKSALFMAFEGPLPNPMPPFFSMQTISPQTDVILSVMGQRESTTRILAALSPAGGYAAKGYILHLGENQNSSDRAYWILNPLEFFRSAFNTDELPKPDTATLMGQRIYYSHIDGDGWNNISDIKDAQNKQFIAAEIILDRVISAFPSLPVTVAPIAADLHPDWHGGKKAREVARTLFSHPHVEVGSHTFTHPYIWQFFEDYTAEKEARFRSRYLGVSSRLKRLYKNLIHTQEETRNAGRKGAVLEEKAPRAYLDEPFSLTKEITESVDFIESFAPPGKKVKILQWSGDTEPFDQAIAEVETLGLPNINGGDAHLKAEFPSLASLSPVGLRIRNHLQIYSSNSDESSYVSLWTQPCFGFRHMTNMLHKTETPTRIKPFNLYYHMSSGEKEASLNVIRDALDLAKSMSLTPITTSHYALIGQGFFSTRFMRMGERQWKIFSRGALQTIRFDNAALETVDFERSSGIIGQKHYQGSLYVTLDEAVKEPVLALKSIKQPDVLPIASQPYLISSSWRIWDLQYSNKGDFSFAAQGFGDGEIEWRTPALWNYKIVTNGNNGEKSKEIQSKADKHGRLEVKPETKASSPIRITVRVLGS